MRNIFIIGMLLVGAFMAGWFKINRNGDHTTIEINRAEIRNDTRKAIDRSREILDRSEERLARHQEAPPYDSRFDQRTSYPPVSTMTDSRGNQDGYYEDRLRPTDRSPSQQTRYQDDGRPREQVYQDRYEPDSRYPQDLRYESRQGR